MSLNRLLTYIFILIALQVQSQQLPFERTGYVGGIMFFSESQVYKNSETHYQGENKIEINIPIVSPQIRIGVPHRGFMANRMITVARQPQGLKIDPKNVSYRIEGLKNENEDWKNLPQTDREDYTQDFIVLDTVINNTGFIRIFFREKTLGVFQTVNIYKVNPQPELRGIRFSHPENTTLVSLREMLVKQRTLPEEFAPHQIGPIKVPHGMVTEFIFSRQSILPDSSLFFRLIRDADTGKWQQTSHFSVLKELKSNQSYYFEVKYAGSSSSFGFELIVLPQWHEKISSILIIVLTIMLMIITGSFLFLKYKLNREKKKESQNLLRLKAVQSQLNPHFIFNALSSIQGLVNMDQKAEANQYLTIFSEVLRHALKSGDTLFVSLDTELELLKNYMEIEQLRFQFSYSITVDPLLNLHDIEIPPMLLQPSIENAIKHGGGNKGKNGRIGLTIEMKGPDFVIEISDNGSWSAEKTGYGISLTKQRIAMVNEWSKVRKIGYQMHKSDQGTLIRFTFKDWLN